jgi:ribosomal peptide maturation radical SAM protein 1
MRVLIAVMPFLPLERPALGPAILKRGLESQGIFCDVRYFQFRFADLIGFELYQRLAAATPTHDLAGEWLFTRALYGEQALPATSFERYTLASTPQCYDHGFFAQIEYCRDVAVAFVAECVKAIPPSTYDIVGFSSTFQQNLSSLALAKALKEREPLLSTVFGGANCEDAMGAELHRVFPFVDYVCSGESDEAFPRLVRAIRDGADPSDIAGLSFRRDGASVRSRLPQQLIEDMDGLPVPDHSDFLDGFRRSTASLFLTPQLTMETSRGCWWGQKHHCTFCGLNGLGMRYRAKSVRRAYREVKELIQTYGINSFFNTDNILDLKYFFTLFPMLESDGVKVELYYETKSNLRKSQLAALKRIGTNWIQPGIESLSTHVLRLMDKGVSAIQNVQVLKWAREFQMALTWNLICGFPGECAEDYLEIARLVPLISHLQPPASFARFRADRFSPVFNEPERFGVTLRPYASYALCYPGDGIDLDKIAYFFNHDASQDAKTVAAVATAWEVTEAWRRASTNCTLAAVDSGQFLVLLDNRLGRAPARHLLTGPRRAIYRMLDTAMSPRGLLRALSNRCPEYRWSEDEVREILGEFENDGLTISEGGVHLALAVMPAEDEPDATSEASTEAEAEFAL